MMTPPPEFTAGEYGRRVETLQDLMRAHDLDAIFIADEPNYHYYTGHFTESWLNRSRACAAWLPREGNPIMVLCETDEEWARITSWSDRIVAYSGPVLGAEVLGAPEVGFEPMLTKALIEAGGQLGLTPKSRVGIPLGSRTRVQLPLGVIDALRVAFEHVEWVDACDVLWQVRAIKSPAEVEAIRSAVAALDYAMPLALRSARVGMTELELAQLQRSELLVGGAHHIGYTNVVADLHAPLFSGPSSRALERHRPFYVDGGAQVGGYWSDYCRIAVIDEPADGATATYTSLISALDAGIAHIRAGVSAGSVARAMANELPGSESGASIGRMGHANGLEMPEPPSIHPDDRTLLEAGMVLAVEPNVAVAEVGSMVVEDMVVVTANGCLPLSTAPSPRELLVV